MTAQDLKNSILQMAIQGKLVKQDPNDEPASILLEKIKEERNKLIKEKKIKKEKYSEIYKDETDNHYYEKFQDGTINDITHELPFEIPDTWCWQRFKNIFNIINGFTPLKSNHLFWNSNDINWFTVEDFNEQGYLIHYTNQFITNKAIGNNSNRILPADTVIICCTASIGTVALAKIPLTTNQQFNGLVLKDYFKKNFISEFIYYYCLTLKKAMLNKAGKTTFPFLSVKKLSEFLIPMPSTNEQKRIVEKIELFMPYINQYNNKNIILNTLNSSYKEDLKKSILQYAIQGKLVSQNPEHETAENLINKILEEKRELIKTKQIKKENLSVIYKDDTDNQFYEKFDDGTVINITDEIPFDIPNNWTWTRIKNLSSIVSKGTTPKGGKSVYLSSGINFLRAENVKASGKISLENVMYIDKHTHQNFLKRSILEDKDILICIAGTLGRCAVITNEELPANTNQAVCFIRLVNKNDILINFILKALSSFEIQKKLLNQTKVTAIPNLTLEIISNCLIPIPPINEQKNIIDKLKKIFNNIG